MGHGEWSKESESRIQEKINQNWVTHNSWLLDSLFWHFRHSRHFSSL